jgi:hypothetical protein
MRTERRRRVLWFLALWGAGVLAMAVMSLVMRGVMAALS